MKTNLRLRLAFMMFWQYAAWGAWMPILSGTMVLRHQDAAIGPVYSAFWLGFLVSPFLGGQLVDRFMPGQVFLGISNLLAAGAALVMSQQTTAGGLELWMLIWAILFTPGLGVTNAIAFRKIEQFSDDEAQRERDFSWIRTAGTIGWVVAAVVFYLVTLRITIDPKVGSILELQLTAVFGVIMAVYSFTLPNTPPSREKRADPLAFRKAFGLIRTVPGFGVFMAISFFAATEFMFFYNLSAPYLQDLHIPHNLIPINKSISQIAEVGALGVLLPLWLPKKGMRWCLLVGSFAWPLRYVIFAIGKPVTLVVSSLGLHGFGYAFVMIVQQLYVDRVAPRDIRASAQSLLNFTTLGIGNVIGSYFCGMVQQHFTNQTTHVTHWAPVFILPAATTLICAIAYMVTFRDEDVEAVAARQRIAAAEG